MAGDVDAAGGGIEAVVAGLVSAAAEMNAPHCLLSLLDHLAQRRQQLHVAKAPRGPELGNVRTGALVKEAILAIVRIVLEWDAGGDLLGLLPHVPAQILGHASARNHVAYVFAEDAPIMLAQTVLARHTRCDGGEVGVEFPRRVPTRVAHLSGEAGSVVSVVPQDLDPLRPAPGVEVLEGARALVLALEQVRASITARGEVAESDDVALAAVAVCGRELVYVEGDAIARLPELWHVVFGRHALRGAAEARVARQTVFEFSRTLFLPVIGRVGATREVLKNLRIAVVDAPVDALAVDVLGEALVADRDARAECLHVSRRGRHSAGAEARAGFRKPRRAVARIELGVVNWLARCRGIGQDQDTRVDNGGRVPVRELDVRSLVERCDPRRHALLSCEQAGWNQVVGALWVLERPSDEGLLDLGVGAEL